MNRRTDPSRPAAPSVREIAALTARLREITARGRTADPAERAQFLADKQALLDRIRDAGVSADGHPAGPSVDDGDDRRYVGFGDWGDDDEDRYQGESDLAGIDRAGPPLPRLPGWVREQVHRTEAEIAAGVSVPGSPVDPEWISDGFAELHATREELLRSVSWAVAARDAAIEQGGSAPAGRFAQQAREAITAAEAAGISREQLVAELDYPGGAAELDGDHIRIGIVSGESMTAAELAAQDAVLTGRGEDPDGMWGPVAAGDAEVARVAAGRPSMVPDRAVAAGEPVEVEIPEWMLEKARRTEAEIAAGTYVPGAPDDRERLAARLAELRAASEPGDAAGPDSFGRDDPTWWAPTGADEVALSHHEVATELAARGFNPEQARAAVTDYLDDTSDRIGIPVHEWAMDSHDVEAIAHTHRPPALVPEQRHPGIAEQPPARGDAAPDYAGERGEWEQARGGDQRSYEQMMGDAAGALTNHRPERSTGDEGDRREQLVRWHNDDAATGPDRAAGDDVIGSDRHAEPVIVEGWPS